METNEDFSKYFAWDNDPDTPEDCHRHCLHWDTEGTCCGCGEIRTPNHNFHSERGLGPGVGLQAFGNGESDESV